MNDETRRKMDREVIREIYKLHLSGDPPFKEEVDFGLACWNAGFAESEKRVEKLVAALADMFKLMDEGHLVRDTSRDHEPAWVTKSLVLVQRLKAAYSALAAYRGSKDGE